MLDNHRSGRVERARAWPGPPGRTRLSATIGGTKAITTIAPTMTSKSRASAWYMRDHNAITRPGAWVDDGGPAAAPARESIDGG